MAIQTAYTLNANEIYSTLANLIISQEVFADNFGKHQTLVDKARVDGSLYGDKKLYYSCKALETHDFLGDSEASNLLAIDRAKDPKVQAITLNVARQIRLTTDSYLSKRAWQDEGAFASFTSVLLGLMGETKKIYEGTEYNVFIGNHVANKSTETRTITLDGTKDGQIIAEAIANLLVEMSDYSEDFNEYGFLRSYDPSQVKIVWNSKFVNKIKKVDTPTIFHKSGLVDKLDDDVIPAKYFGRAVASDDKGSSKVIGTDGTYDNTKGTIRVLHEVKKTMHGVMTHLFAGQEIPNGTTIGSGKELLESDVYIEDSKVICKVLVRYAPWMSAFEVGTSFFNPRSLTTNNYITFMHNTLEALDNYPFVTIKQA